MNFYYTVNNEILEEQQLKRLWSQEDLFEKFPSTSIGVKEWRKVIESFVETVNPLRVKTVNDSGFLEWKSLVNKSLLGGKSLVSDDEKGRLLKLRKSGGSPRIFVSHRHDDVSLAIQVARKLQAQGCDVWLDVWDPSLTFINVFGGQLGREVRNLIIALIIEMALINSTHVLALITGNTRGSYWVPYEYGRVKQGSIYAKEAACLYMRNDPVRPGYLNLGKVFKNQQQLNGWP